MLYVARPARVMTGGGGCDECRLHWEAWSPTAADLIAKLNTMQDAHNAARHPAPKEP